MQIILKKKHIHLGEQGEVVKVKDGYARNYLIPNGVAIRATEGHIKSIALEKQQRSHKAEQFRKEARDLAAKLELQTYAIGMKAGENGRLFGTITPQLVLEALHKAGLEVGRKSIHIPEHIKETGKHNVQVKLYEDITATITIVVEAV